MRRKKQSIRQQLIQTILMTIIALGFLLATQGLQYLILWSVLGLMVAGITLLAIWYFDHRKKQQELARIMAIKNLRQMNPFDFERRVGEVMRRNGYKIEMRGGQADNGLDLILHKNGISTAVQVKRYAGHNQIGEPVIREFFGSFIGQHQNGIFVTTSDYTRQAKSWASTRPIKLLNWHDWINLEETARIVH